jgi:hypothetical protein
VSLNDDRVAAAEARLARRDKSKVARLARAEHRIGLRIGGAHRSKDVLADNKARLERSD